MGKQTAKLRSSELKKNNNRRSKNEPKPEPKVWAKLKFFGSVIAVVRGLGWAFKEVDSVWNAIKEFLG